MSVNWFHDLNHYILNRDYKFFEHDVHVQFMNVGEMIDRLLGVEAIHGIIVFLLLTTVLSGSREVGLLAVAAAWLFGAAYGRRNK